jgi:hypothetical protein
MASSIPQVLVRSEGQRHPAAVARCCGNHLPPSAVAESKEPRGNTMRGILLWLLGVPIFVIILLYLFVF